MVVLSGLFSFRQPEGCPGHELAKVCPRARAWGVYGTWAILFAVLPYLEIDLHPRKAHPAGANALSSPSFPGRPIRELD
ncbi:hypothetical protein LX36DRAFT_237023 [Colletotrichum falcatum]|nr:hypothetical protein LX36DRAFT_237023 [Colletotrichum falcatum]